MHIPIPLPIPGRPVSAKAVHARVSESIHFPSLEEAEAYLRVDGFHLRTRWHVARRSACGQPVLRVLVSRFVAPSGAVARLEPALAYGGLWLSVKGGRP